MIVSLSQSLSGCANGAPLPPDFKVFQPIINQKLCDDNGVCEIKNLCREYYRDLRSGEFILVQTHELKKCSGTFGVDADDLVSLKDYTRRVQSYIEGLQNQISEALK
jgi:hypothetical protein